jgi:hypothetical protein
MVVEPGKSKQGQIHNSMEHIDNSDNRRVPSCLFMYLTTVELSKRIRTFLPTNVGRKFCIDNKIVLKLFPIWEVPDIDLFASHQNTDLLLMESRSSSLCTRYSNNSMEQHVCLCISSPRGLE